MRATTARLLTVAVTALTAVALVAGPAHAARRTPTTTYGGYCDLDGFAIPTVTGILKRVDYGAHANCFTGTRPREIIVQSHLYSGSSRVGSTSLARCYDCYEISVISSYTTLITTATRAETDLTVHLYPSGGEKFLTPAPPGCTVYNSGHSIWCHVTDYA